MAIITDFFVASRDEFEQCFEDWLPVSTERYIEKTNPFTKETYLDWGPDPVALSLAKAKKEQELAQQNEEMKAQKQGFFSKLFGSRKDNQPIYITPDISAFPHVNYYRVDLVKLTTLYTILGSLSFDDALDELGKPAYVLPDYDEQGIHIMPDGYVNLLARLQGDDLQNVANQWWQTEELQMDGFNEIDSQEVLAAICRLAATAISEQKFLFHWWCL